MPMLHTLRWLGYGMYGLAVVLGVLGMAQTLVEANTHRPYCQGSPVTGTFLIFVMAVVCTAVALILTVLL